MGRVYWSDSVEKPEEGRVRPVSVVLREILSSGYLGCPAGGSLSFSCGSMRTGRVPIAPTPPVQGGSRVFPCRSSRLSHTSSLPVPTQEHVFCGEWRSQRYTLRSEGVFSPPFPTEGLKEEFSTRVERRRSTCFGVGDQTLSFSISISLDCLVLSPLFVSETKFRVEGAKTRHTEVR